MTGFTAKQKVYNIGGVEIGGQPGERPAVLIGSIFYAGHGIVYNPVKGSFNKEKAKALLEREQELSIEYGNPYMVDVIGDTAEALIGYIEFVAANSPVPVLIDSPSQKVRTEAIRYFAGSEIVTRLVYNAIAEDHTDDELGTLKECGIKSAVVLAFSTRAIKPADKIKLLEDDLLPAARAAGVEQLLIDTGVLDMPGVSWSAIAIHEVKESMGYPAGCAPANALYTWETMRARDTTAFRCAASAALSLTKAQGADFVLYGPMSNAPWVYPAVATADALVAYGGRLTGIRPATQEHPLFKVFKR